MTSVLIDSAFESAPNIFMLRARAAALVCCSPMVERAAYGDPVPLITAFWPFVNEFPLVISRQLRAARLLPILGPRIGWLTAAKKLWAMRLAVRSMALEEGDHGKLWAESAVRFGVTFPASCAPSVALLLTVLREDRQLWRFLARLAATEFVAEELARRLPVLGGWSAAHLMSHDGPSHLDMDLDLALACHPDADGVTNVILSYMGLFAEAARGDA